tara:strand:- start:3236 stop:4027 length:792 start_codon:yes stop_codon:yes gene_type:complete
MNNYKQMGYQEGGEVRRPSARIRRAQRGIQNLGRELEFQRDYESALADLGEYQRFQGIGETIGNIGGTLLGSLVPGVGTIAGKALGGTLGSYLGGSIGGAIAGKPDISTDTGIFGSRFQELRDIYGGQKRGLLGRSLGRGASTALGEGITSAGGVGNFMKSLSGKVFPNPNLSNNMSLGASSDIGLYEIQPFEANYDLDESFNVLDDYSNLMAPPSQNNAPAVQWGQRDPNTGERMGGINPGLLNVGRFLGRGFQNFTKGLGV